MPGTLYLVATPIGNLGDFSPRAREVMSEVDFIAAEDTRVTKKLMTALDLPQKPLVSYYEHNRRQRGEEILARLLGGENCALVTDAGTPAVSDPGEDLVALCAPEGVPVIPVPGCCAAVCALAASGLPTGRWCFEGFLSVNKKARREHLDALKNEKRSMIFYEAPHKLRATLDDLCAAFGGERRISLSRELTKLHEETLRMTLAEAVAYFAVVVESRSGNGARQFEKIRVSSDIPQPLHYLARLVGHVALGSFKVGAQLGYLAVQLADGLCPLVHRV